MDDCSSGFCIRATTRGGGGTGTKCGRWNPTAEQVKVLTELFRSGLRTPSTDQIQKISSQLSFYGKIESKNVFYWFQNHKARERQKRRRVSVGEGSEVVFNSEQHDQRNDPIKFSSPKLCGEIEHHQIRSDESAERVVETLQLFPLNSLSETDSEKLRQLAEDYKENYSAYDFNKSVGTEMEIPTLDLRLSFFN